MACRFLIGFVLSFLLLSPLLKRVKHHEEKPVLVFMQDNSGSLKKAFTKTDSAAYRQSVSKLLNELRDEYIVKEFSYGDLLSDSIHYNYTDQSTDLTSSLEMVMTTLENENLGAVLIAGDGIVNKGISPLSLQVPYKGALYTIGLGDTTLQRDATIARVFANKLVYLGDQFSLRTDMAAYACKGKMVNVSVYSHNQHRMVTSQNIEVSSDRFSRSVETVLEANMAGVQHFTVSVSRVEGESNVQNNVQEIYVEVIDSKQKILVLANAPHPDIFALRDALSKNKNFALSVATADRIPTDINNYNLIILHNLPSSKYSVSGLIDQAKKTGISLWFITGSQTLLPAFNQVQTAMQITSRAASANDVQAIINKDFSYFTMGGGFGMSSLPPLSAPFGDFSSGSNAQVLATQRIGGVSTQFPLWVMQQNSNGRVGVLAGEGIWRWRLYDYNEHKNHNLVDEYLLKTAQFLSVKHDQKTFRISTGKSVFTESESIQFDGELYNENYELINFPDVNLEVVDSSGKKYPFALNKNGNTYSLNIGNLSAGKYTYTATTSYNNKEQKVSGNLVVVSQNLEEMNTTADFGLLNQLASAYHGEFVYANQIASLKDKIAKNKAVTSILRSETTTESLISWKWLFAILLLLLSLEWFIRKRMGLY